jgi:hypothetical protein
MLANTLTDKPIVVDSDSRLEDRDDNLDDTHTYRTFDSEQLRHSALDLDILPSPLKRSADKIQDSDNDNCENAINSNVSPRGAKRQNSASSSCESSLRHTSTPILAHDEDVEYSTKNADSKDADELRDDDFVSKRRKLSAALICRTSSSSHDAQSPHSLSPVSPESEEPEDDGTDVSASTPVEDNLASTARTTPEISVSASLRKPQLSPELDDTSRDWEVREVIGKEYVHGVLHYMVEWCPTLQHVHSLEHAKELVDKFEARLRALRKDKEGRVGPSVKRDRQVTMEGDVLGGQQKKRPRGPPRKQK